MAYAGNLFSTSRGSSKLLFVKVHILLLHENNEVGGNFTFFEVELLKLRMFGRPFEKLS
jgi:hypothetical protein